MKKSKKGAMTMQEYLECDNEFLALIINYPYLIDKTIIKSEYLIPKARILFSILLEQKKDGDNFIIEKMALNKNFDVEYYAKLLTSNIYNASRETKFKEIEKYLIERYKKIQYKNLTSKFDGNCKKLYDNLTKINEINYNENDYVTAKDIYNSLIQKDTKIKLGYPYLDNALNLSKNDLLIVAGGTGTGKTAFALNLLNKLSNDYQCIYFNMEMSKKILYKRLLAINTGITIKELENLDKLSDRDKNDVSEKMQDIERRKIILVNKVTDTEEIKKDIANINTDKHIIAFVDHIGLIRTKGNNLYEKMTNIAKELRSISMNNDCTLIGLCQLSRESQRSGDEPKLQDLRDSGEIEQSARKVLFLNNKTENKEQRIHQMDIIIAKNDDGDKLIKSFRFDRYNQIFNEIYNGR
jgi:replicative DNA helicase